MVMGTFLFKEELSVTQSLCWQRVSKCKATWKTFLLLAACTRTFLQLLRCRLRGRETHFSLDRLLTPCTWQKLQLTGRQKLCIPGAGAEAGHPRGKLGVLDDCYSFAPLQSNPWVLPCLSISEYFRKLSSQYWGATCLVQSGWDRPEVSYWSAEEKQPQQQRG